jgi:hypothetical protein
MRLTREHRSALASRIAGKYGRAHSLSTASAPLSTRVGIAISNP